MTLTLTVPNPHPNPDPNPNPNPSSGPTPHPNTHAAHLMRTQAAKKYFTGEGIHLAGYIQWNRGHGDHDPK